MFNINVCQWLDSDRGPLELEATALPTEPQPRYLLFSIYSYFDKQCDKQCGQKNRQMSIKVAQKWFHEKN